MSGAQRTTTQDCLHMLRLSEGFSIARAVQLAAELGIADLLADGSRSADELAAATSTHAGALYRLLRALAAEGVFAETAPGRFGLTHLGALLRTDHPQSLLTWVRFQAMFNGVYADAIHSFRTGEPAFPVAFGDPIFRFLEKRPDQGEIFNVAMAEHSRLVATVMAESYDFGGVQQIVDVGGGCGTFLSGLLSAWPTIRGIVYDLPYVADAAHKTLAAAGLGDRCTFVGGDFLQSVPAGADCYVLKGVVHNWDDDDALTLLRNCRKAVKPDGKVVLIEWVVPTGDTPHPSKLIDLSMLVVYGGQERTEQQFIDLFDRAGLRLVQVVQTPPPLTVIEAVPA